jgi:hypothetical protein
MGKSLSHLSDEVTQLTNKTGITDDILEINPGDGTLLRFLNRISTGDAEGLAIIQKLKDGAGNDLPADTEYILRVERPTDDGKVAVSVKEDNIAAWNGLSTSEQRNEENIDAVKIELNGAAVNVRDKDKLYVSVNSSAQIDWANSEWYVVREGVEELPFEG